MVDVCLAYVYSRCKFRACLLSRPESVTEHTNTTASHFRNRLAKWLENITRFSTAARRSVPVRKETPLKDPNIGTRGLQRLLQDF